MHSRLQHASIRILLYAGLASGLLAQTGTAPSGEPAAPSAAKAAPPSGSSPSAAIPGNDEAAVWTKKRQAKAATALQEANRLRTLYTEDPVSARAPETRRQEALALITAAQAGDESQAERLAALVDIVRQDAALPETARCEVVARRSYQQAKLGRLKTEAERFAAIERIERSLTVEFPSAPNGYEALYRLALYSDDTQGRALATEVAGMEKAPGFVKVAAQQLLARYALIGTALQDLLPAGASEAARGQTETAIYAWSARQRDSIAFAKFLQKNAPSGLRLIGVCLDRDEAAGRAAAQAEGLAGEQLYDPTGELSARLRFDWAPLAYVADAAGEIRLIGGVRELTRRLSPARSSNAPTPEGR
jgi:hypothetical protein